MQLSWPRVSSIGIAGLLAAVVPLLYAADLSDDAIRALLVRQSLASYSGNCPCPEHVDRAGRKCGKRSAYSKPGGESPLCYPSDVTSEMIARYRKR